MSIAAAQSPIAPTDAGPVLGRKKDGVLLFCGLPYAMAPIGERRFQRPARPEPRDGLLDATRFGPAAPQLPSGGLTNRLPVKWDEDCLSLNVCTPGLDGGRRPVLVWIHGGAYRSGQGAVPWYNGKSFALNGDIVLVSINYRLGALGFTDLSRFGGEYATSGINGILDQIAALEWVRDNIANFGGDPEAVTLAGESAGGFSVAALLGCELAGGLFHRAILQSGAAHHTLKPEVGEVVADLLIDELGAASMRDLLDADALHILEAQNRADARYNRLDIGAGVQAFYPVEGNEVLPVGLRAAIEAGAGSHVPVLAGTNKDENTLFLAGKVTDGRLRAQARHYGSEALADAYRALLPGASDTDLAVQMGTDYTFRIPAIRLAETRCRRGGKTWMYRFDWESGAPHLKATHALEIPFVFNTLDAAGVDVFIGPGEKPRALAAEMHGVWTRFIRSGEPGWPEYNLRDRPVMHFDEVSAVVENGDAPRLNIWEGIR